MLSGDLNKAAVKRQSSAWERVVLPLVFQAKLRLEVDIWSRRVWSSTTVLADDIAWSRIRQYLKTLCERLATTLSIAFPVCCICQEILPLLDASLRRYFSLARAHLYCCYAHLTIPCHLCSTNRRTDPISRAADSGIRRIPHNTRNTAATSQHVSAPSKR